MNDHYILSQDDGRTPVIETNYEKWLLWFNKASNRFVAFTELNGTEVSTAFLGIDLAHSDDDLHLFETCIFFEDGTSDVVERCATWDEAEAMHQAYVEHVSDGWHKRPTSGA